jgi:hypothetical protein
MFLLAAIGLSSAAWCQLAAPSMVSSADYLAARSKTIVIGRITESKQKKDSVVSEVTIRVEQTIKGLVSPQVEASTSLSPATIESAISRRARLLFMIDERHVVAESLELDLPDVAMSTSGFEILRGEDEITAYLEKLRPLDSPSPQGIAIGPLDNDVGRKWLAQFGKYAKMLLVPLDANLEKWALAQVASRDVERRVAGVSHLSIFPTERNIALMKELLKDPGKVILASAEENWGDELTQYPVRQRAYDTLTRLGVKVEMPQIQVERSRLTTIEKLRVPEYFPVTVDLLSRLLKARRLTELVFEGPQGLTAGDLQVVSKLKTLKRLVLPPGTVDDDSLGTLGGLKKLEFLSLDGNAVTSKSISQLKAFPKLKELSLRGTRFDVQGLRALKEALPKLKVVTGGP